MAASNSRFMKKQVCLFLLLFLTSLSETLAQNAYQPDKLLRPSIRQEVWKKLKPLTPQKYQFLMSLIFKGDEYFNTYRKTAQAQGLPPNELATIETFFSILCEEVVRGVSFSDTETRKRYSTTKESFSRTQKDFSLSDRDKQRKYEPLILKAMWVAQLYNAEKKNKAAIQELAKGLLEQHNKANLTSQEETPSPAAGPSPQAPSPPVPNPASSPSQNYDHEIEDIIMRTVTNYGLSGMYIENEVNILFKNGDVFTNPSVPLEKLDVIQSKRAKPNKWDTWKRIGNILQVKRSKTGKLVEWKKWFKVRPAPNGFRIQGVYSCSDAFGGAVVINASVVSFDKQGRFAWKTVKGGNTSWKPVYSHSRTSGTYSIQDHTLVLKYNNGAEESFFFGLYPKDDQHFIIGLNHFVPTEK